ncbi:ABC transporter substrate-binding protein [Candidatus Woesearchaeota archaeon]|nr:ABC transporter substrate-binding protein [Candidatus Woesearchaeota archaeon]
MKKIINIAVAFLSIAIIISCTATGKVVQQKTANEQEQITLAWIGPMTGQVASLGLDNLHGVELAVDKLNKNGGINNRQIRLLVEDDQLDAKQTIVAFQKITSINDPNAILSPSYSGLLSIASEADKTKRVIVDSLDTSEEIAAAGEFLFGIGVYDEGIGYVLAEFADKKLQKKDVAIIYFNNDAFAVLVKDAFTQKFASLGGDSSAAFGYAADTTDFRTILLKIKDKGIDTILFVGYDESGFIVKQARELQLNVTFLAIDTVMSQYFFQNAAEAEEGLYFSSWNPETPEYKQFLQDYKQKFEELPQQPLYSATGYDSVMVLAQAMRSGNYAGEPLKDELYKITGLKGISGTLTMSSDGIVRTIEESMFQMKNKKGVAVQ